MIAGKKRTQILLGVFVVCCFLLIYTISIKNKNQGVIKTISKAVETSWREEKDESKSLSPTKTLFKLYDEVEVFVMFIGYPRSSHSLMASLLDAHPEIIIPHEYNIMGTWQRYKSSSVKEHNMQKYLLFYDLHRLSTDDAMFGIRSEHYIINKRHSYTYRVPDLWQGGYDTKIKVIGDKKGGETSLILEKPDNMAVLEDIQQVVQVPMKFIHVTRNPFDNIATMMLMEIGLRKAVENGKVDKVNSTKGLNRYMDMYFKLVEANERVRQRYGEAVIDIPGHQLGSKPRETLQKLCDHLKVTCSEDYFEKCSEVIHESPSVTRHYVIWTDEQKARVNEVIKKYSFLQGFSFED